MAVNYYNLINLVTILKCFRKKTEKQLNLIPLMTNNEDDIRMTLGRDQ